MDIIRPSLRTTLVLLLICWSTYTNSEAVAREYVLARAPQMSAVALSEAWLPFLKRLLDDTGIAIRLKVYPSRQEFEGDLFSGSPDFAFMNPYYAVLVRQRHGYIPLVRDNTKQLHGVIVVRKDSAIRSIEELEQQTIAFPSPNAMAASLYPRALLAEQFNLSFQPMYVGTHENVYRAVLLRRAAAGGGVVRTLETEPEELKSQLRILYTTPGVAPHPLVAHPRVPAVVRERLTTAIIKLHNDAQGRALLHAVKLNKPVRVDYERDYVTLEKLGLEGYTMRIAR